MQVQACHCVEAYMSQDQCLHHTQRKLMRFSAVLQAAHLRPQQQTQVWHGMCSPLVGLRLGLGVPDCLPRYLSDEHLSKQSPGSHAAQRALLLLTTSVTCSRVSFSWHSSCAADSLR